MFPPPAPRPSPRATACGRRILAAWACALPGLTGGEPPADLEIRRLADGHELSWSSRPHHNYQVERSLDLDEWEDAGAFLPGTGERLSRVVPNGGDRMYFRIRESPDLQLGGFLRLPLPEQRVDLIDGVIFSFDLGLLPEMPEAIRIFRRSAGEEEWLRIGSVSQFGERDGFRYVRGSVVWMPPAEGEYEVLAVVAGSDGTIAASAQRQVSVGANQPPVVTITGLTDGHSELLREISFETEVEDPDGDLVTRVEFFDNGVLIGTDWRAPFGDSIRDAEGERYDFLRGRHEITARAYDSRGAVGDFSEPFVVEVAEGNSRPVFELLGPDDDEVIREGEPIAISFQTSDPDGPEDVVQIRARNLQNLREAVIVGPEFGELVLDTSGWNPGSHVVSLRAYDAAGASSYPAYLRVYVKPSEGESLASMLAANLVDGVSAIASQELFRGVEESSGEFEGGLASGLQMDQGILLTTGWFSGWNGGNISEEYGRPWGLPGDDRLRDRITAGNASLTTHDAAVLEFDLFCEHGQLEFEFQFGSEEYEEYVGDYNDGFLITVDDVIVSLVPDGRDIVSVNSVNRVPGLDRNSHLYLDNDDDIRPNLDPENLDRLVEYNGMTAKLRSHVLLEPGRVYRVRIVIADALDGILDSGIFLERDSMRTVHPGS